MYMYVRNREFVMTVTARKYLVTARSSELAATPIMLASIHTEQIYRWQILHRNE